MIINLSGEVDYVMFDKLIKALTDLKVGDNLHIYLSTNGGLTDVAEGIIDLINKNKEFIGISFYGEVFSAGMTIFFRTECKKWLLPDTTGMYHYAWQEVTINEGGKPSSTYDIFCMKEMKKAKNRTIEYLKTTKLNDKEIKDIKLGKDVYLTHDRMLQLL